MLAGEVLVEEKVDGANVTLWLDGDRIRCALRAGIEAMDRAGQVGPLRAWVADHDRPLRTALSSVTAMYAEWMWLSHTVVYDRLPSYLVALDLWRGECGFVSIEDRDAVCRAAELVTPPPVWRGTPGTVQRVEQLLGRSSWSTRSMEGLVVRRLAAGEPRLAKLVPEGFDRVEDEAWRRGRPRNLLTGDASWR